MAAEYSMTLRLDAQTRERLREIVAAGYRSSNAAILDAINRQWETLRDEELDAGYAAAVQENPAYPYESQGERAAARTRRNARHKSVE